MIVLLLEPAYKNKYPPLGLMKIATYHKNRGDEVYFTKSSIERIDHLFYGMGIRNIDRIYITTLFSFEWKKTEQCIDYAIKLAQRDKSKIFVGGISASLMNEEFKAEYKWEGIRFIQGILKDPPAISLQLKESEEGYNDTTSQPIDELTPDYSILDDIALQYEYDVSDAYFGYASRGCVRKCAFCGVPKLEGDQRVMPSISGFVNDVAKKYGEKKDLLLMDNNITAALNFNEVIAEIKDLGFQAGAKLKRDGKSYKRRVDFNQGVDSRILSKNPNLMKRFSTICISPLRIAFDHLGVKKHYIEAMNQARDNGLLNLSNYMLYNFMDTPQDLYTRLAINIELNTQYDMKIWSFPMRFQPITMKDRSHVGKHWNSHYLRSFQLMLQATHGVVSAKKDFFNFAYGDSSNVFMDLLMMPHSFIFNREHFFSGDGKCIKEDYEATLSKLCEDDKVDLLDWLSSSKYKLAVKTHKNKSNDLFIDYSTKDKLRHIKKFYVDYHETFDIKDTPTNNIFESNAEVIPRDEKVEDAGLHDNNH